MVSLKWLQDSGYHHFGFWKKIKAGNPVIVNHTWWCDMVIGKIDFIFDRTKRKNSGIYTEVLEA